ncbi:MAG: M28 family peptidase [Bacteroidales bacterium]
MKRSILFLFTCLVSMQLMAADLFLIRTSAFRETEQMIKNPDITVNLYRDDFVIATTNQTPKQEHVLLDRSPWSNGFDYYIVYTDTGTDKAAYLESLGSTADLLYDSKNFMIVRRDSSRYGKLPPAKQDGLVYIQERKASLPAAFPFSTPERSEPDPFVQSLLDQVDGTLITDRVQHMEDYGTRDATEPESIDAQEWIESQFLDWGLDVEVMSFTMPGGPSSDNVIATKTGTEYPDEYIVVGGHYDSTSYGGDAPGADDNASGTSGVMEIARILSEYEFDRSIIFCAFSGEEYGLHGSEAYASRSADEGMDIFGYFNMDMIGYLEPGHTTIMSSLIYPESAQELADFYTQVAAIYLPDFVIETASFIGGDSDHSSFNDNGYMGIFPFEDTDNYSPYIHTSDDVVGLSYNHEEQAVVFTQAALASVVTMANMLTPPRHLIAIPGDEQVELQWNEMTGIAHYNIYRDGALLDHSSDNSYTDYDVENEIQYSYYVTAVYEDAGEESGPSNEAAATPMPPVSFPLVIDFENGAPYWNLDDKWGITTEESYSASHALTESPYGSYEDDRDDYATLQPLNLMGYSDASLSFMTKYDIEENWDFMYLEISIDGINYTTLDTFTGAQNSWTEKTYSLADYLDEPFVSIRFHFYSDYMINEEGMYIDDFTIVTEGGYETQTLEIPAGWSGLSANIIPADAQIANLMQPINNKLIAVQNMSDIYWPAQSMNTIGSWNRQQGYKVKMEEAVSWEITGNFDSDRSLDIHAGWNLIPVLSQCHVSTTDLLSPHEQDIVLVKEVAGNAVYWPAEDISTLDELAPGSAYFLKAGDSFTVDFPFCDEPTKAKHQHARQVVSVPWDVLPPTGNSHTIAIPGNVLNPFAPDDVIGVFTPGGNCAGIIQLDDSNGNRALTVFAHDSIADQTDGFVTGQQLSFKHYEAATGEVYELIASYDDQFPDEGLFAPEGISGLTGLETDVTGMNEIARQTRVYPVPAGDYIHVVLPENKAAEVNILNLAGQSLLRTTITGQERISLTSISRGTYLIRLRGDSFSEVHKLIIR